MLTFNSLQQILNTVRKECIPFCRIIFPADGQGPALEDCGEDRH